MTTFDAAGTALVDQAQAASDEGLAFMHQTARLLGTEVRMARVEGSRAAMVNAFYLIGIGGRLRPCSHLTVRSPQPQLWCAWKPARLNCGPCGVALANSITGTVEDSRCDHCGQLAEGIHPGQILLPATAAPQLRIASGPTLLLFGFCSKCFAASGGPLRATETAERARPRGRGRAKAARGNSAGRRKGRKR